MKKPGRIYENNCSFLNSNHLRDLNKARLSGRLCDVTIKVNDTEFEAHKIILGMSLKYFEKRFFKPDQEIKKDIVTLKNAKESDVEVLLEYAYTGHLVVTESNALSLFELAHQLFEDRVEEACVEFLKTHLKTEDACLAYKLGHSTGCNSLKSIAKSMIAANFRHCSLSEEYLTLDFESIKDILAFDRTHFVCLPEAFFETILRWILHDVESRRLHVDDVLNQVEITKLTPQYVFQYCREIINNELHGDLVKDIEAVYQKMSQEILLSESSNEIEPQKENTGEPTVPDGSGPTTLHDASSQTVADRNIHRKRKADACDEPKDNTESSSDEEQEDEESPKLPKPSSSCAKATSTKTDAPKSAETMSKEVQNTERQKSQSHANNSIGSTSQAARRTEESLSAPMSSKFSGQQRQQQGRNSKCLSSLPQDGTSGQRGPSPRKQTRFATGSGRGQAPSRQGWYAHGSARGQTYARRGWYAHGSARGQAYSGSYAHGGCHAYSSQPLLPPGYWSQTSSSQVWVGPDGSSWSGASSSQTWIANGSARGQTRCAPGNSAGHASSNQARCAPGNSAGHASSSQARCAPGNSAGHASSNQARCAPSNSAGQASSNEAMRAPDSGNATDDAGKKKGKKRNKRKYYTPYSKCLHCRNEFAFYLLEGCGHTYCGNCIASHNGLTAIEQVLDAICPSCDQHRGKPVRRVKPPKVDKN